MATAGPTAPALSPEQPALDQDSNVSSPLSDVEDADGDDASFENMHLNHDRSKEDEEGEASDSNSELSEANDTEAETERLYDTPQAQRQRDVVMKQFDEAEIFEHTPSKLKKTFSVDEEAGDRDHDLSDRDDASMISSHRDNTASPTKPGKSAAQTPEPDTQGSAESKKRKRSPAAEQSDPDQPLRKRTGSVGAPERTLSDKATAPQADEDDEEELSAHPSGEHSGAESTAEDSRAKPSRETASPTKPRPATKKITRSGSKQKTEESEGDGDQDLDTHEKGTADEEAAHNGEEERHEPDAEDEAEAAARDVDEREDHPPNLERNTYSPEHVVERKRAAMEEWNDLEAKFGLFRERLYKDRLERLEAEERSLQSDTPTHPEYLLMKQCLDDRLAARLREINQENELATAGLERLAVARRAQIWAQFYQGVREKREQFLESLNQEWYETQNARRSAHSVPEYGIHFPTDPARRTRNAVAYNAEVSYLSGLAKHEGFPSVPAIRGASTAEIAEDFEAIKRDSRPPQIQVAQPVEDFQAMAFSGKLGPAGEHFINSTPWANPNHISHKGQPAALQPEANSNSNSNPPASGLKSNSRPRAASRSKAQANPHSSSTISEASPETLRTAGILSQDVPHMKRTGSLGGVSRGPKATQAQESATKRDTAMAVAS